MSKVAVTGGETMATLAVCRTGH